VQRALSAPDPLVRLGGLEALQALAPEARANLALPLVDDPLRAVRVAAARTLGAVPASSLNPPQRLALERGLAEYRESQAAQADQPGAHLNLALLALEQGQPAAAERELDIALRLGPQFVPAYVNLADVYRAQGRDPEAEKLLRRAVAIAPGEAAPHHALGLLLVRQKRLDEALLELQRAADLDPAEARHAYVLGVALASVGRTESALEVLRRAQSRRPTDRDLLVALATMSRDAGARDEARAWAAKLLALDPDDPGARALVRQLSAPE
jgi:tetratricopeptide (TPR) repeat protein